jgi:hypothetical protein
MKAAVYQERIAAGLSMDRVERTGNLNSQAQVSLDFRLRVGVFLTFTTSPASAAAVPLALLLRSLIALSLRLPDLPADPESVGENLAPQAGRGSPSRLCVDQACVVGRISPSSTGIVSTAFLPSIALRHSPAF